MNQCIPGLRYIPEYIDRAMHDDLLARVGALPWTNIPGQRRMQFYGYTYDYPSRSIKRTGKLPLWARKIAERIHEEASARTRPRNWPSTTTSPVRVSSVTSTRTSSMT